MLLPVHLNKRKNDILPDVREKQYLQLQVQPVPAALFVKNGK